MPRTLSAPGPRRRLPWTNFLAMHRDPLGFLTRLAGDYGDVAHFRLGPQHLFLLNHPDYIRDVLVTNHRLFVKGRGLERAKRLLGEGLLTSEGEHHLRQRRLTQPAFHRDRITGYATVMVEYAARHRERWTDGAIVDIHHEIMRLTLGIVGKTLFDADIDHEATVIGEALATSLQLFRSLTIPFAEVLERLPVPATRRFEEAKARLDATVLWLIREHRASGVDRGDLLSMLLQARDLENPELGMTEEQLRDEVLTILLAGHETTANAITWALYLLSQHPEAAARVESEVDQGLSGRLPTAADVPRLRYTTQVLAEAMRLYPPAWIVGRRALQAYEVAGFPIPAGSILLMSPYVTHRDARFFPQPLAFDPERWVEDTGAGWPFRGRTAAEAYFPFGAGPRICIGEQFAWMEEVLLLATLTQRWRMRLQPGHPVELAPSITLRPKHGMWMVLERR